MATKYWDYANGDDTTGDGSPGNPFKTLNKASTEAGAGGECRCAGRPLADLPVARWQKDSTTVGFSDSHGLVAGDFIRCEASASYPSFRVTGVSGNTVYISQPWRGKTGDYETLKITAFVLTASQTLAASGQLLTFGWDLSTESQPDGWVSAFSRSAAAYHFDIRYTGTTIAADGRLITFGNGQNASSYYFAAPNGSNIYITGVLDASDGPGGTYCGVYNTTGSTVCCETVAVSGYGYSLRPGTSTSGGFMRVIEAETWDAATGHANAIAGKLFVGRLIPRGGAKPVDSAYGEIDIGELDITYTRESLTTGVGAGPRLRVGYITGQVPGGIVGGVCIGGPVAYWRYSEGVGVADKVAGRGGTGYGLRLDPASAAVPLYCPLATIADASKSVSLRFYAYFSGSSAPTCWVELREPNGLTVQKHGFSPSSGASWDDATLQTVDFTGTTAQAGSLQVWLCVQDNAAGDAIVYVDDVTWTGAGDQGSTSGLEYHGLVPLVQTVTGGVAFPLGL